MGNVFNLGGGGGSGIKLVSINIKTPPQKVTYTAGETFNPAGMVVQAVYSNGATAEATGYSYTPSTALQDGAKEITVKYTEGGVTRTAVQAITVVHRLESISVTKQPDKAVYEYQDRFEPAGMVVEAVYSDGAREQVSGAVCTPEVMSRVGSQIITVSYTEREITKTTSITVTVERKSISGTPSQNGSLTYTGSPQSPTWSNYLSTQLTLGGVTSGTAAGSYDATFTPTENYRWSDGTTTAKTVSWRIGKAAGSLTINPASMTLTTASPTGKITVTRPGNGTISAVSNNQAAATVSVSGNTVTVTGKANGKATITISVAEGSNHTAPASKTCSVDVSFLKDNFADNEWSEIIAACKSGSVPASWTVGNYKNMTINGKAYRIDIIGKNHDTYAGGGTAPLTFQIHDCYTETKQMNGSNTNSGGWNSCAMRSTHLPAILNLMPAEVKAAIREVQKKTSAGSQSSSIQTTNDKLFLLSEIEIFGSTTYSFAGEGKQYDYYKAGNSKVKNLSGSAYGWWERSPYSRNSTAFCFVDNGGYANAYDASNSRGVAFGFCF